MTNNRLEDAARALKPHLNESGWQGLSQYIRARCVRQAQAVLDAYGVKELEEALSVIESGAERYPRTRLRRIAHTALSPNQGDTDG